MGRSTTRTGGATATALVVGLCLLLAGLVPAAAGPGGEGPGPRVTLRSSSLDVAVGDRLVLSGRTSAPRGARVLIQRRAETRAEFRTVRRARVARQGRISYAERPGTAGRFRLRACVRHEGRTACSKPLRVLVTEVASPEPRWYHLHDGGPVAPAAGEWCERPETLAGVLYEKSVAFGANCHDNDENYGEVALDGACTTFEAVVGLSDASSEDSRYDVHVRVDGTEVYGRLDLARGQAEAVSIDLTGARRLRLEGPFVAGKLGNVVFGDARVWCDF